MTNARPLIQNSVTLTEPWSHVTPLANHTTRLPIYRSSLVLSLPITVLHHVRTLALSMQQQNHLTQRSPSCIRLYSDFCLWMEPSGKPDGRGCMDMFSPHLQKVYTRGRVSALPTPLSSFHSSLLHDNSIPFPHARATVPA